MKSILRRPSYRRTSWVIAASGHRGSTVSKTTEANTGPASLTVQPSIRPCILRSFASRRPWLRETNSFKR